MKVGNWQMVGEQPYTRKSDGAEIKLVVWESRCAVCGTAITAKTPVDWQKSNALKAARCSEHAKNYPFGGAKQATKGDQADTLGTLESTLDKGIEGFA